MKVTNDSPDAAPPTTPVVPLEYGHADHVGDFGRRTSAGVAERFDGFFEFLGMIAAMVGGFLATIAGTFGGLRQILFAIGVGLFSLGLIELNVSDRYASGPSTVAFGTGLIALCIPLPKYKV